MLRIQLKFPSHPESSSVPFVCANSFVCMARAARDDEGYANLAPPYVAHSVLPAADLDPVTAETAVAATGGVSGVKTERYLVDEVRSEAEKSSVAQLRAGSWNRELESAGGCLVLRVRQNTPQDGQAGVLESLES